MSRADDIEALEDEISFIDETLAAMPPTRVLDRYSFEERRAEVVERLEKLLAGGPVFVMPRVRSKLVIEGGAVTGSRGAEAEAAGESLAAFARAVRNHSAHRQRNFRENEKARRAAARAGSQPFEPAPAHRPLSMSVTGTIHGSFGFMLEDLEEPEIEAAEPEPEGDSESPHPVPQPPLPPDEEALDEVVSMMGSVTSDESLEEFVAKTDVPTRTAIRDLFAALAVHGSGLRVSTEHVDRAVTADQVKASIERIEGSQEAEDEQITLPGHLKGVIVAKKMFDFVPKDEIHALGTGRVTGTLDPSLTENDAALLQDRYDLPALAFLRVTRVLRPRKKIVITLQGLWILRRPELAVGDVGEPPDQE